MGLSGRENHARMIFRAGSSMRRAPVYEENSGAAAASTSVRFSEWRGLNSIFYKSNLDFSLLRSYIIYCAVVSALSVQIALYS